MTLILSGRALHIWMRLPHEPTIEEIVTGTRFATIADVGLKSGEMCGIAIFRRTRQKLEAYRKGWRKKWFKEGNGFGPWHLVEPKPLNAAKSPKTGGLSLFLSMSRAGFEPATPCLKGR